jgi:hypothetical protein
MKVSLLRMLDVHIDIDIGSQLGQLSDALCHHGHHAITARDGIVRIKKFSAFSTADIEARKRDICALYKLLHGCIDQLFLLECHQITSPDIRVCSVLHPWPEKLSSHFCR